MRVCLKVCDMYVRISSHGEFPAVLVLYCMCINVTVIMLLCNNVMSSQPYVDHW